MSFSLLFLGPKYATGTTSGKQDVCILATRQRAQSFMVKTACQGRAVHIKATGRKTGACRHSALTFSPLPGPQPMGWHHPRSGWIFSLQLVLLGDDGPGRGELLPPRCSHVNSKGQLPQQTCLAGLPSHFHVCAPGPKERLGQGAYIRRCCFFVF